MIHVTCRLTAKNRDQLRDHTLGNRVWATFTFLGAYSLPRCRRYCFRRRLYVCLSVSQQDNPKRPRVNLRETRRWIMDQRGKIDYILEG